MMLGTSKGLGAYRQYKRKDMGERGIKQATKWTIEAKSSFTAESSSISEPTHTKRRRNLQTFRHRCHYPTDVIEEEEGRSRYRQSHVPK